MKIKGINVEAGMPASELVGRMECVGLQASELAKAVRVIKEMKANKAKIFLTFTSNMVSSGLRELIAQLVRDGFVDVIITNVGSIEEDAMKSFSSFELSSFDADDAALHGRGENRVGNIIIPSSAYVAFESFVQPLLKELLKKQEEGGGFASPSEIARLIGERVKDEDSFLRQAFLKKVPVYCPAPTDGAFGLQLFYFKQDNPAFVLDVTGDMKALSKLVLESDSTGGLILGGGAAKHHAIGLQLVRGGFDYVVYVTTATEFDGSLSGARVREAVSWGKVKERARFANVYCEASIALPLIVSGLLG